MDNSTNQAIILISPNSVSQGTDQSYLEKLHHELGRHPYFVKGADKRQWSIEFGKSNTENHNHYGRVQSVLAQTKHCMLPMPGVLHYAGPVTYQVNKFLQKNKDVQQDMFFDFLELSSNPFCREIAKYRVRLVVS